MYLCHQDVALNLLAPSRLMMCRQSTKSVAAGGVHLRESAGVSQWVQGSWVASSSCIICHHER